MSTLNSVWAPIATIIVAVVGALSAWFVAKRKGSGTVKTSDAQELWSANKEFREMLIEEARARTADNAMLRKEAAECHQKQAEMEKRMILLERELTRLRGTAGETV